MIGNSDTACVKLTCIAFTSPTVPVITGAGVQQERQ